MPTEIVGQQLRIRVIPPSNFTKFRTQELGSRGRLQRVAGYSKKTGWKTQSFRLNLSDYRGYLDAKRQINRLGISAKLKHQAKTKTKKYFKK